MGVLEAVNSKTKLDIMRNVCKQGRLVVFTIASGLVVVNRKTTVKPSKKWTKKRLPTSR